MIISVCSLLILTYLFTFSCRCLDYIRTGEYFTTTYILFVLFVSSCALNKNERIFCKQHTVGSYFRVTPWLTSQGRIFYNYVPSVQITCVTGLYYNLHFESTSGISGAPSESSHNRSQWITAAPRWIYLAKYCSQHNISGALVPLLFHSKRNGIFWYNLIPNYGFHR